MFRSPEGLPASTRWQPEQLWKQWLGRGAWSEASLSSAISPAIRRLAPGGVLGSLLYDGRVFEAIAARVEAQAGGLLPAELLEDTPSGYYFLHIPKTAGTSLGSYLDQVFARFASSTLVLWDQLWTSDWRASFACCRFFRGHLHLSLEPLLKRRLARFTVLREPVARTISHYRHVVRAPDHPYHELATRQNLLEFCTHPETRHMVENYQARYLVDFGLDPFAIAPHLSADELAHFTLQILVEQATLRLIPDEMLLEAAARNLQRMRVVGVTEDLEPAALRMAEAAGLAPAQLGRLNVTPGEGPTPKVIDPETRAVIEELTQVDRALHQMARHFV